LLTFGALFLPLAIWFAWKRYWGQALAVGFVAVVFLRTGLSRDEDSWIAAIDELGTRTRDK
jgi:hypothetical protein